MIRLLTASLLLAAMSGAAFAVPYCESPQRGGGLVLGLGVGDRMSETEQAEYYERRLRQRGVDANETRMWNYCIQTFVTENGHVTMRFFDPFTLREIPLD